eukprot:1373219-Pyramimonas_sp.AAC.1
MQPVRQKSFESTPPPRSDPLGRAGEDVGGFLGLVPDEVGLCSGSSRGLPLSQVGFQGDSAAGNTRDAPRP